jgi:methionyl aminopeptidase
MIHIKSAPELIKMRASCQIVAELLDALAGKIVPGVNTLELDQFAFDFIASRGGRPAFKGYTIPGLGPFPGTLCTSVNAGIVHGIPSEKVVLREGDIIGIDVGACKDGFYGDAARTYAVGAISGEAKDLMRATEEALRLGISEARPGNRVGDISHVIGEFIRQKGYYVADSLTGHGIGRDLHEDPQIPNAGPAGRGPRLKAGMTLAIEPMVNIGTNRVTERGWEFFSADNSLSAHFEHTILITDEQPEILTQAQGS